MAIDRLYKHTGEWISIFDQDDTYTPGREDLILGTYFPDSTNTGLKDGWSEGDLSQSTGNLTITTDNTVIENRWIHGFILVRAANVTVSNCIIDGDPANLPTGSSSLINANHASAYNLVIEDTVVRSSYVSEHINGIGGHDYTARRVHAYNVIDTFGAFNTGNSGGAVNVKLHAVYGHDLMYVTPSTGQSDNRSHNDNFQIQGNSGIEVIGCTLLANASSTMGNGLDPGATPAPNWAIPSVTGQVIGVTPNVSGVTNVLIEKNFLDYGGNTITIIPGSFGTATGSGIIIRDNTFGNHQPPRKRTADPVFRRRCILIDPSLTVPGMPTTSGPDISNNVDATTGLPITVWRMADSGPTGQGPEGTS